RSNVTPQGAEVGCYRAARTEPVRSATKAGVPAGHRIQRAMSCWVGRPWAQSGEPRGHRLPIGLVFGPELALQGGFFVPAHERGRRRPHHRGVDEGVPRLPNSRAWPTMATSSPTYIGLRTYRLNPLTTSRRGAATGRGVPPALANSANADTTGTRPTQISSTPMIWAITQCGSGWRDCQPVISQGISPAKVPGATRKNAALPSAAVVVRIMLSFIQSR